MNKNTSITGKLAQAIIAEYPEAATMTLARMLYNKNKKVFSSIEHARVSIRYYRNESGNHNRRKRTAHEVVKKRSMPQTWAKPKEVFEIPTGYKKVGIISDVQCPYHDEKALEICAKYLNDIKIDCLLINGDFVDFYGLSSFEKDPRRRNFAREREDCIELLRWLKEQFPKIPIYYSLDANHEIRYERYMMIKAPEVFSTNLFHIEDLLMLHDIGIIPLKGYDHVKIGKLPVLHGHTIFRGQVSPVSPARTIQMKLNQSAVCSHVHKKSQYTWTNLDGETHSTWTTGCLMNLNVEYNPHGNNYVHGFAYVDVMPNGMFAVENKMIIKGRVV